jgi:hypothetical protein
VTGFEKKSAPKLSKTLQKAPKLEEEGNAYTEGLLQFGAIF